MLNRHLWVAACAGLIAAGLGASAAAQSNGNYNNQGQDSRGYDNRSDNRDDGLTLICWGEGRKPNSSVSTGYAYNYDSHKFTPQTYVRNSTQQFDSAVQMEFRDGRGRIHLTGKLIPPIHSGGDNGWWEFDEVAMGPDKITARYRLNGMNKPRVTIDRRTGRVTIDGIEKFRGECDQGNWGDRGNRF